MTRYTSEQVQEIVEDWEGKYNKLEEEYTYLKEEYEELEEVCDDLQKLNKKLVRNNKTANRDFFILATAYAATLMLMIYLFIR